LALPARPAHVSVNVVVTVRGPVDSLPFVGLTPLHPPDASHLVAFVVLHVSMDVPPPATVVGFAVSVSVGGIPVTIVSAAQAANHAAQTTTPAGSIHPGHDFRARKDMNRRQ
jgi:hypothetical protein